MAVQPRGLTVLNCHVIRDGPPASRRTGYRLQITGRKHPASIGLFGDPPSPSPPTINGKRTAMISRNGFMDSSLPPCGAVLTDRPGRAIW